MIHWKSEGDTLYQGFNFYKPSSNHSAGFILLLKNRVWRMRYSKYAKKWFFTYNKIDPQAMEKLRTWEALHGIKHD